MAENQEQQVAPTMTPEEMDSYRELLRAELKDLEESQQRRYSTYKRDRIKRIRGRLGIAAN